MDIQSKDSKKILIKSITRTTSATGVHNLVHPTSGKKLGKNKIGKSPDRIQAPLSRKTGKLLTGLNKPWTEKGKQKVDEKTGRPLLLQHKMERKWNLPDGYLTDRRFVRGDIPKEDSMTYYQKKAWSLRDGSNLFDLSNMDDELGYYVMLEHRKVANSEKEWKAHKWPKATHYISLENESESIKHKKNAVKVKAFASLSDSKLTSTMKDKFVKVLDLARATSQLSTEQVENLLYDYIEKSSFTAGSNIDKFNELFVLNKEAAGRLELEARYLLKSALDSRVIYEKQGSYTWPRSKGSLVLGDTYQETIDFLLSPKKESLIEELREAIKFKTT
jgi:hypothetical protein